MHAEMDLVTRFEQGVLTARMAIAASQRGRRDGEYCLFVFSFTVLLLLLFLVSGNKFGFVFVNGGWDFWERRGKGRMRALE